MTPRKIHYLSFIGFGITNFENGTFRFVIEAVKLKLEGTELRYDRAAGVLQVESLVA